MGSAALVDLLGLPDARRLCVVGCGLAVAHAAGKHGLRLTASGAAVCSSSPDPSPDPPASPGAGRSCRAVAEGVVVAQLSPADATQLVLGGRVFLKDLTDPSVALNLARAPALSHVLCAMRVLPSDACPPAAPTPRLASLHARSRAADRFEPAQLRLWARLGEQAGDEWARAMGPPARSKASAGDPWSPESAARAQPVRNLRGEGRRAGMEHGVWWAAPDGVVGAVCREGGTLVKCDERVCMIE